MRAELRKQEKERVAEETEREEGETQITQIKRAQCNYTIAK